MATQDETAQMLFEIEQIRQLKARYFRFIDERNWKEYVTCFTEDYQFLWDDDPRIRVTGGAEYVKRASRLYPDDSPPTVHHGHNPEIEITGKGTAKGIWALGNHTGGGARYYEEYEKGSDGRWRIRKTLIVPQIPGTLAPEGFRGEP